MSACAMLYKVGDGTTSVVLLAGEFLKQCKSFIEEGVHPQVIVKAFRRATSLVQNSHSVLHISLLHLHLTVISPSHIMARAITIGLCCLSICPQG